MFLAVTTLLVSDLNELFPERIFTVLCGCFRKSIIRNVRAETSKGVLASNKDFIFYVCRCLEDCLEVLRLRTPSERDPH